AAVGSVLTPLILLWLVGDGVNWRPPFIFIGMLGLTWVVGWFWLVRRQEVDTPATAGLPTTETAATSTSSWMEIFRERRFWVLAVVVICINSTWHFFRVWMPV